LLKSYIRTIQKDKNLISLLRDSGMLYVAGIFSIGLTFLQQMTTARWLGAEAFGQFATIVSSGTIIFLLIDFRTREVSTRYFAEYEDDPDELASIATVLLSLDIVVGIIGIFLLYFSADLISVYLLHDPSLSAYVRVFSIILPFRLVAAGVTTASLRLFNYFGILSIKSVIYGLLRISLISGLVFLGYGLKGAIIGLIISECIHGILMLSLFFIVSYQHLGILPIRFVKPQAFASFPKMLMNLWLGETLQGLQAEMIFPILAFMTNPEVIGIIKVAHSIAELIQRLRGIIPGRGRKNRIAQ